MNDSFLPMHPDAKDGFERMYRFSDNDHWAWWNRKEQSWFYRPHIGPEYRKHPGEPTHFKFRAYGDEELIGRIRMNDTLQTPQVETPKSSVETWEELVLLSLKYIEKAGPMDARRLFFKYGATKLSTVPIKNYGSLVAEMRLVTGG